MATNLLTKLRDPYIYGILSNHQVIDLLKTFLNIECPIIHTLACNIITIFDPYPKKICKYTLKRTLNWYSKSISFHGRVFIFNGELNKEFYEYDFNNEALLSKMNTLISKQYMGICECEQFIYNIGGWQIDPIAECEKYDVLRNQWLPLKKLNKKRGFNGAFQFNHKWIYALCGYSKKIVKSIERTNAMKIKRWEIINPSFREPEFGGSCMLGIQIEGSKCLLFGGSENYKEITDSFVMDIDENGGCGIYRNGMLRYGGRFINSAPMIYKDRIYAIDDSGHFHVYDIKVNKWVLWT